jgi:rod shape determining protein RodA
MFQSISQFFVEHLRKPHIDWILFFAILPLLGAGLVTMTSFVDGSANYFFDKQLMWIIISLVLFFLISSFDVGFLNRTFVLVTFFCVVVVILAVLLVLGKATQGAVSWIHFGGFSVQPSDPAKLVLILILAKYFNRRHIEIANIRHIIVSGLYAFIFFALIFLQGDFGDAIVMFFIWLGMIMVSGVSKKHLLMVFVGGTVAFTALWMFVFLPYQKARIMTFIHPLTDIRGTGYNAYQSTIAVGSGETFGKGIGYGTQSRLKFLPEYQTDFVFAAFAEEWGFVGVAMLFFLFFVVIWRILVNALHGSSNFEILFGLGLVIMFISLFTIHVGMNIGLLPVTGNVIPFVSYGGSHLLTEFAGLGILMSMRRNSRPVHQDDITNEMLSVNMRVFSRVRN